MCNIVFVLKLFFIGQGRIIEDEQAKVPEIGRNLTVELFKIIDKVAINKPLINRK